MAQYQGSCHCGAIRFTFEHPKIDKGLRCNCSFCSRRGALMTSEPIPPDKINIQTEADTLGLYQFGAKSAKHYFCKQCGIYPFHETARFPGHLRANLGCVDGVDSYSLPVEIFDGRHLL